ncbi:hypothetical protein KIF59_23010 [Enterobacter cloacae subsp. cloacae]|nr:hypothetical protein [Enterobacter cloacae subsp. cloacae]
MTDDSQPSFSGEGTPGNTIIIKDNDKENRLSYRRRRGKWSFTPKDELAEGEYNVVVVEGKIRSAMKAILPIRFGYCDTTPPAKPDMADAEDNTGPITGQLKAVTSRMKPVRYSAVKANRATP